MTPGSPNTNGSESLPRMLGAYELLSPVGDKGEMWAARVADAGAPRVGRFRPVSLLRLVAFEDPDAVALVLDQARVVARIDHPNVARVLDVVAGDPPHVVLEWLSGASLERIARTSTASRLPVGWGLAVVADVLAGLHAAHEITDTDGRPLRLVHRDVSPENVIVTFDGRVKVVDFAAPGARRGQAVTRVLGSRTPYFAPEQVAGEEIDRRADVFSAGALLYLLLTGVHPFAEGQTAPVEAMQRITDNPVTPPSTLVPGLSPELDAIVLEALAKDPKARFQTAAALQRAIENAPEARPRPTDQEIGKVVTDLFPGEAEERALELARALESADAAAEARAASQPAPEPPSERRAPRSDAPSEPRPAGSGRTRTANRALLASRGDLTFAVAAVVMVGIAALLSPSAPAPQPAAATSAPAAPPKRIPQPKPIEAAPIPQPEPASEPEPTPSTSSKPPRAAPKKTFAPKGL